MRISAPASRASSIQASTRSRASRSISGPTSVALVRGVADDERLHLGQEAAEQVVVARAVRRRSAGRRCSSGRRTRTRSRRASRPRRRDRLSASTITGVAFPSSSLTRLRGARSASFQPTSLEPVNVIARTRSSSTSTSPISDAGPDEHVQPAGRKARLGLELREQERRERRLRRGLQHDRAAGGERRRDLVGDEVEREVERRDRADDADRQAQREGELPVAGLRGVHRHHLAGELPRLDGGHRERRHRARRLDLRRLQRLAGLGGDRLRDLLVPAAEVAGDADEDLGALVRRQRLAHGGLGGVDRAPGLGRACLRDPPDAARRSTASAPRPSRPSRPTRRRSAASSRTPLSPSSESTTDAVV